MGKIIITCWAAMKETRKLRMVAVKDIGIFATKAIEAPREYRDRAISPAADELTYSEANAKFRAMYGKDMPRTFGILGGTVKMMVAEVGLMFEWFEEEGYGAGVKECSAIHPGMQDFATYLTSSQKFEQN
jgi:hypothetical protein